MIVGFCGESRSELRLTLVLWIHSQITHLVKSGCSTKTAEISGSVDCTVVKQEYKQWI